MAEREQDRGIGAPEGPVQETPVPETTAEASVKDSPEAGSPGQEEPGPAMSPETSPAGEHPEDSPPASQLTQFSDILVQQAPVEDPVEILVAMAERGEIDPWNINIIEVTDRFLSELERRRELNLQISGRTLFFAATLLRMKSDQLAIVGTVDEEGEGDADDLFGEGFDTGMDEEIGFSSRLGPIERLEHEIQRRLDRKNMRKSPVTLFELIVELKNLEKAERRRRRMEGGTDFADSLIDADDVVSIAHEEGFQESAMIRLAEYLEGLELNEEMTLAELCERMEWGVPEVFIPLLFLALDGRCSLRQEEFYGDIWVQICRPPQNPETAQDSLAE